MPLASPYACSLLLTALYRRCIASVACPQDRASNHGDAGLSVESWKIRRITAPGVDRGSWPLDGGLGSDAQPRGVARCGTFFAGITDGARSWSLLRERR